MLLELGVATLAVLATTVAIVLFFCGVEAAPGVVRETERSARFAGLDNEEKLVRFW